MSGANLVIPAQICDQLLVCEQSQVYGQMDGRTDTGNDNTPLKSYDRWIDKQMDGQTKLLAASNKSNLKGLDSCDQPIVNY